MKKKTMILAGLGGALLAVAGWFLVRNTRKGKKETPPKNAPQLPIENPGDQSEFLTAPSESEMG